MLFPTGCIQLLQGVPVRFTQGENHLQDVRQFCQFPAFPVLPGFLQELLLQRGVVFLFP